MRVSVSRLIKIRNKVAAKVNEGVREGLSVEVYGTSAEDVSKAFEIGVEKFIALAKKHSDLHDALFTIRELISDTNNKSGVHKIIHDIAFLESSLKISNDFLSQIPYRRQLSSVEDVHRAIEYSLKLEEADSKNVFKPSKYSVNVVSEEFIQAVKDNITFNKKAIEVLQEQRNELNFKTPVEIPKDVFKVLVDNELI